MLVVIRADIDEYTATAIREVVADQPFFLALTIVIRPVPSLNDSSSRALCTILLGIVRAEPEAGHNDGQEGQDRNEFKPVQGKDNCTC